MRHALVSLLLVMLAAPLLAAPLITEVQPGEGFSFAPTHVTILGTGFAGENLEVFFGTKKATVVVVSSTAIQVLANPPDPSEVNEFGEAFVNVTVKMPGFPDAFAQQLFFFSPFAQPGIVDYKQVLVPLTSGTVPGAHGSRWTSELHIFNASTAALRLPGPEPVIVELPIDPAVYVPARKTEQVFLSSRFIGVDGAFLYVPRAQEDAPKFSLRVRDLSQNAASLGTDIPVVSIDEAKGDLTLIDIPVDPAYRATLRVYAFTQAPMLIGVKVFPEDGDTPIQEYSVPLNGIVTFDAVEFPPYPAYTAFDPLTSVVRAANQPRVRIEITNFNANVSPPPPPIWAFVSITSNSTQQVTAVVPK
jgi:hypothetical protein